MADEPHLSDLVSRWQELRARGEGATPEDLCSGCPELVPELREKIRALESMEAFIGRPGGNQQTITVVCPPPGGTGSGKSVVLSNVGEVPGYEILGELGRGGMGVVYKARQIGLKRLVALKRILTGGSISSEQRDRFLAEAEAAAQLRHPNIVQIFDVGEHDGVPFFSLEYVEGGNLATMTQGSPLPPRQAALLVKALAGAIHLAHQRGVVHRDLKPQNILLALDGTPKITDFGLAKRLYEASGHTRTGDVLGTPSYMAPEQAAGRNRQVGPPADIYSLGAILYELLTGRPPFRGQGTMDTLHMVLNDEPVPPSRLRPQVPRDLETICLTCLNKDPERRYPNAGILAEDLAAYLGGQAIQARPPGPTERAWRWARRHPFQALFLAAGIVAVVALGVGLFWHNALALGAVGLLAVLALAAGYHARLLASFRDADRLRLNAERNVERMRLLLETTRRVLNTTDLEELLHLLGETSARLTNAERATIFLVDHKRKELWSKMMLVDEGEIRVPLGKGIAGTVAVTGETINLADAYADSRFNPDFDKKTGFRTRSIYTVPMTARDGRILGVFQVLNKQDGTFGPEDGELLCTLAAAATTVIEKMRKSDPVG